jgi:hypothetical protein
VMVMYGKGAERQPREILSSSGEQLAEASFAVWLAPALRVGAAC